MENWNHNDLYKVENTAMNWPKRMKLYDLPPFYLDLELAFCDHEKFQWILWTSFRIVEISSYLEKSILIALTSTLSNLVLIFLRPAFWNLPKSKSDNYNLHTCGIQNFGLTNLINTTHLTTQKQSIGNQNVLYSFYSLFERWALALEFIWIEKNTVHE